MDNSIVEIITVLRKDDFYGSGKNVEIAKGKHQIARNFKQLKNKVKRIIKS